jgi:predicted O-methyltransferase YrrM
VILAAGLEDYLRSLVPEPDPVLAEMQAHGDRDGIPIVYPETGLLLEVLVAMVGARTAVEVGTAIGVSTLHIARALQPGGTVISFEVDAERHGAARAYLDRAGVGDRADLRLNDAADGLAAVDGPLDFAFLDAFKNDYPRHLELVLPLLRPGGAVVVDNVLLSGAVHADRNLTHWSDEDVLRMRAFNADLVADRSVIATVLPVGDGVAVAVRRSI